MNSINVDGVHMQMCQDCGRYHLNIQSCKATLLPVQIQAYGGTKPFADEAIAPESYKEETVRRKLKDPLTRKERGIVEHVRADLPDSGELGYDGDLLAIIDKLVKKCRDLENDRPLKYTREEIITKFVLEKKPVPDETGNWHLEDWKECNQVLEHARFLGVLKESKKCRKQ